MHLQRILFEESQQLREKYRETIEPELIKKIQYTKKNIDDLIQLTGENSTPKTLKNVIQSEPATENWLHEAETWRENYPQNQILERFIQAMKQLKNHAYFSGLNKLYDILIEIEENSSPDDTQRLHRLISGKAHFLVATSIEYYLKKIKSYHPEDFSPTEYNDVELVSIYEPKIATVCEDFYKKAHMLDPDACPPPEALEGNIIVEVLSDGHRI
ncbi:MAG: hypothetical protein LRY67_04915 [Gammaproteobacteria bacterium]|nr:hypothetical protein [Gammaproteobacteria bacterium]